MRVTCNGGTKFVYNGDYSGPILIQNTEDKVFVTMDDLLEFFATYISDKRIAKIEQATAAEIIKDLI